MAELLRCDGITKKYGPLIALNNIDLSIEGGRIIGLLGPNGSGKTTLIKLINGLLTPTSGSLTVCGGSRSRDEKGRGIPARQQLPQLVDDGGTAR